MLPTIHLFGLTIPIYGLCIATAVVFGYNLSSWLGRRHPLGADHATTLYVAALPGAFVGIKALEVIVEGKLDWRAGGVFLGGFIGVVCSTLLVARWKKLPALAAMDLLAPVGAANHFFGRLGCLAAGCCYGKPTSSGIGLEFPSASVAYQTLRHTHPELIVGDRTVPLIPTQLIEALFELGLAAVLLALLLRKVRTGVVFGCYAVCYALFRFGIEFYRFDPERGYLIDGVLSTSQFISILLGGAGGWVLWRALRTAREAR
ncbi:MAG: prolipoprotein diacylglyceryl transferase [Deltaproteobacteria bacterium]|nr:prolipoprotein diacylglyceryl transferase [Deltaproteobacteria bacterium]